MFIFYRIAWLLLACMCMICIDCHTVKIQSRMENKEPTKVDIVLAEDLRIREIMPGIYLHISTMQLPKWGAFPSNGLILKNESGVVIIDTPWTDKQTVLLLQWVESNFGAIRLSIITHAHQDRMGGISALLKRKIEVLSLDQTAILTEKQGLLKPNVVFSSESKQLLLGKERLELFYPGPGHSPDNIVVWIPDKKILFAGCLIKSAKDSTLGSITDANLERWPHSISIVKSRYPLAQIVISGHGKPGGIALLDHTLSLLNRHALSSLTRGNTLHSSNSQMVLDFQAIDAWLSCCRRTIRNSENECIHESEKTIGGQIAQAAKASFGEMPSPSITYLSPKEVSDLVAIMKTWPDVSKEILHLFPQAMNASVRVFIVANGSPWGDGYVRKIIQNGKRISLSPQGESVVVLNPRLWTYTKSLTPSEKAERALGLLRHEVFHIFFEQYRQNAPEWAELNHTKPTDELAIIILNEGIAHFIGQKSDLLKSGVAKEKVEAAFKRLDTAILRLSASDVFSQEIEEILRTSNQGRFWEKYGSISGMVMAYGIYRASGERGLQEAIRCGPKNFIQQYQKATQMVSDLPKLPNHVSALKAMDFCHHSPTVLKNQPL